MAEPGNIELGSTPKLLPVLPDVKGAKGREIFSKVAELDLPDEDKDRIYVWCRSQAQTQLDFATLKAESEKPTLPKAEADYAYMVFEDDLELASDINTSILKILQYKPGTMRKIIDAYAEGFGDTSQTTAAKSIIEKMNKYEGVPIEVQLAGAVCAAINETRDVNKDEGLIRKKIAQSVFDEMMAQLTHDRILYKEDIDAGETSIIDSPHTERLELRSALTGKPWTGEERRKRLREYNKLKRVLNFVEADTEVKLAFGRLWKWANGEIPQNSSVFKILEHAEDLYGEMGDPLQDAWDAELEREEDDEESEDEY